MRSLHSPCNTAGPPPGGASAQAYLRQPVVFLSTSEEWNFSLWSSSKVELLHPEWGMITVLVRVVKASRMIVIFTASQDDRFHSTPAETKHTHTHTHTRKTPSYVSCQEQLGLTPERRSDSSWGFLNSSSSSARPKTTGTHAEARRQTGQKEKRLPLLQKEATTPGIKHSQ